MNITEGPHGNLYLHFDGIDARTAIAPPPRGEDTPIAYGVRKVVDAVAALSDSLALNRKTGHLTPQGLEEHAAPLRAQALQAVDELVAGLPQSAAAIAQERAKLFVPPALEQADAAGAARDAEVRARFGTLPQSQRDQLRNQIARGERDDLLHALLRDPIGGIDTAMARGIWEQRVLRERAEELQKLDEVAHEVEWAASVGGALHNVLDRYVRSLSRPARPTEDVTYGATV